MKLTKQEKKMFEYIAAQRSCTTRYPTRELLIECPSAPITGLRNKGVVLMVQRTIPPSPAA